MSAANLRAQRRLLEAAVAVDDAAVVVALAGLKQAVTLQWQDTRAGWSLAGQATRRPATLMSTFFALGFWLGFRWKRGV